MPGAVVGVSWWSSLRMAVRVGVLVQSGSGMRRKVAKERANASAQGQPFGGPAGHRHPHTVGGI